MKLLASFWSDQDGLTAVEYALMAVLVVVVAITFYGSREPK